MTLAAGLAWGISGISGQYLMSHGVHVNLLTSLRLLITGIFLLSLARSKQKEHLVAAWKQPKFLKQVLLFFYIWFSFKSICFSQSDSFNKCWNCNGFAIYGTNTYFEYCLYPKQTKTNIF